MSSHNLNRRNFIGGAASASAAACLVSPGLMGACHAEPAAPAAASAAPPVKKAVVDWPRWDEHEEKALLEVLNSGRWGRTSRGKFLPAFEAAFSKRMGARHCLATSSGTTALLTTIGALGIGPGDEVLLPPYTFVATFNAITNSYALPVFVDSDAETFQMDPRKVASAITPNTRLVLPVHIGGSPADVEAIQAAIQPHKIPMIEDACQAVLAELHGKGVGTTGLAGCFSFQASKNITSGDGGAIVTNDEAFADLCDSFHTPGGGKPGASSGRGANYRLTEFQASILLAQLARVEEQAKTRDANAAYLTEMLQQIPGISPARLVPGCTRSAWHLYMLRYDPAKFAGLPRAKLLAAAARAGVSLSGGYTSLNRSKHVQALADNPHYQRVYGKEAMAKWADANQCPVNDKLCDEAIWLTQTRLLGTRNDMQKIAEVLADIQKRAGDLAQKG